LPHPSRPFLPERPPRKLLRPRDGGRHVGTGGGAGDGPIGPVDATEVPRFAGLATFARLPVIGDVERCDVAVAGVPFDAGTTFRPGARFGPSAIRQISRLLRTYARPWTWSPSRRSRLRTQATSSPRRSISRKRSHRSIAA